MWIVTVQKTVVEPDESEIMYTFTVTTESQEMSLSSALSYASMVEYGMDVQRWRPFDGLPFPRQQLYQFIQPNLLRNIESMYPDAVTTAYANALAYVNSYFGNMFNVDAMLESGDTSSTALTLRLALCLSTVTFVLASSPQYSDTIEMHNKQLHMLLRGLKSGNRNFGQNAIIEEPDVRVTVVNLKQTGNRA